MIQVRAASKKFATVQALDGLNAEFADCCSGAGAGAGAIHGLIGPDGAGKTTLIRALLGLLKLDHGSIVGVPEERGQIAYMPQSQSLYSDLSISEHLDFFRDLFEIPAHEYQQRRTELLEMTRLTEFVDRPAGALSGGMYKKLGLMCALIHSPRIIILDEPTNGVDPISRREFWQMLYALSDKKENILIIVSTAYMDEAERCSQVHLMDHGRIFESGEPSLLLKHHRVQSFDELFIKFAGQSGGGVT